MWDYPGGIIKLPCCSCWHEGCWTLLSLCSMDLLFRFFPNSVCFLPLDCFVLVTGLTKKTPIPALVEV